MTLTLALRLDSRDRVSRRRWGQLASRQQSFGRRAPLRARRGSRPEWRDACAT